MTCVPPEPQDAMRRFGEVVEERWVSGVVVQEDDLIVTRALEEVDEEQERAEAVAAVDDDRDAHPTRVTLARSHGAKTRQLHLGPTG